MLHCTKALDFDPINGYAAVQHSERLLVSDLDIGSASVTKPIRRAGRRNAPVLPGLPSDHVATPTVLADPAAPIAVAASEDRSPEDLLPGSGAIVPDPVPDLTTSSIPPAADPAVHLIEEADMDAVNTMNETAQHAANTAADNGRALFADWSSRGKDAMEKSAKAWDELGAFYRGNIEAMVESSRIAAKGFESFGQHAAELTRKSLEEATAATKTMSQVKSPTEFMKLQGDLARSAFDAMVAETSRSTETMLKLAGDVAQPMANRMAVAADRMKTLG
jgi:phasin family protein